jgi:peptidyl-prolyl cis-trans isomerase A (cyclophilin A)
VKVAIKNKKGDKEDKKDYYFYNIGAREDGDGTVGGPGTSIVCSGCDGSMNLLYAVLTKIRSGHVGEQVNPVLLPSTSPPAAGRPLLMSPASLKATAPATYQVKVTSTKGDFTIEVHRDWAPLGADRFYNLVKNGFYDDATFFRVIPNFMAQVGINAKPPVTKVWNTAAIKDDPVKQSNTRGLVTFATSGPNSRTTQIFINSKDNSFLDKSGFSPFGNVVEGMDVVDKLYSGYGEGAPDGRGPSQAKVSAEGKPYLDKNFPELDSIKTARIVGEAGASMPLNPTQAPNSR